MTDTPFCYIARWDGVVQAAVVDTPECAKECAEAVAEWINEGGTIERVPVDWVRKNLFTSNKYEAEPETCDD